MGYKRHKGDIDHLRKLYEQTSSYWGKGAYYDEKKKRYIKISYSRKSKYPKYLKRLGSKKVRKMFVAMKGSDYKRVFDYYWTLW